MKKLVIFGENDFAEVARYFFDHDSEYETVAFTVDSAYIQEETFSGLPLVPFENVEDVYPPEEYEMFIAIGYSRVNQVRAQKYLEAKKKGYRLATYISSQATAWAHLKIGDNCFVLENNIIHPYAEIGCDTVLWSGNYIGHHSKIGSHVFVASQVAISGRCIIDDYCFLGANATLFDHVKLGTRTVVGAGALIARDTEEDSVYKSRQTEKHDRFSGQLQYLGGSHG